MNITVTLSASPEFQSLVQSLVQGLTPSSKPADVKPLKSTKKETAPAATEAAEPVLSQTTATSSTDEDTPAGGAVITIEQVRAAVQIKAQEQKTTGIKALLKQYGVPNVTTLTKDKYAAFLEEINAL